MHTCKNYNWKKIFARLVSRPRLITIKTLRKHFRDLGKPVQKLLDDARDEKFYVLKCVEDDKPTFERFSKALTALANASDVLKTRDYGFSDYDLVMIRKAFEQWGNIWPKSFTERNITPKGYILSFVLPKSCEELKTFYKF